MGMTFAEMLSNMPAQMRKLPRDAKGRPIPFFVDKATPWRDGCPDFRVSELWDSQKRAGAPRGNLLDTAEA